MNSELESSITKMTFFDKKKIPINIWKNNMRKTLINEGSNH